MNRARITLLLPLLYFLALAGLHAAFGVQWACAQEGWKEEFDNVCAKTDVAMTLSVEELAELIGRCDRLKKGIAVEDESTRKVYLRRVQRCQDLFRYVLERKRPDR
jgi:hypothetical protein